MITGANTYFAQVIFNKTKKNNHFMGGKKVKEPSLFLLGQIREGRPKKVKDPFNIFIAYYLNKVRLIDNI